MQMKDRLHEQLSALVDNELTDAEQDLLIRQIGRNRELHQRLSRYQLISDAMQNHLPERVDPVFSRRVHDALRNEPVGHGAGIAAGRLAGLFRPVAGLAVAASVAVVAVTALQTSREEATAPAAAVATAPADSGFIRAEDSALAVAPETGPRTRDNQLDIYLVNHNEYAASRGMQGMLPYVRIVGHDMKRDVKD
jgi:sigma-E factor negative regulatory protein RseA